jgi:GntP family gluconate:H+ symporter
MFAALTILAEPAKQITPAGSDAHLITAALLGIAAIITLISWLRVHPFLALALGAVGIGVGAGLAPAAAVTSFSTGFGATMAGVGILVGLGAMLGQLLADSGGANAIVDTLITRAGTRSLPWVMALIGAVIGLPMFFEVGLVLLIPIIIMVARRTGVSLIKIAIPALAGLSAMHGLVPPHPGPMVAVSTLGANPGITLAFGFVVAIPVVIISGPLLATLVSRWVQVPVPALFVDSHDTGPVSTGDRAPVDRASACGAVGTLTAPTAVDTATQRRPGFLVTLVGVLIPVLLMLGRSVVDLAAPQAPTGFKDAVDFLGTPMVALGIALIYASVVFARGAAMTRADVEKSFTKALPEVAGILMIVGAGGGVKQVLIDTGIGTVITNIAHSSGISVLMLAWTIAALIRVATGSATVATVTASGILAPLAAELPSTHVALVVLAVGAGSLFLSHVNDAGFWMVKEYLGTTVGETFKTWTVMECAISLTGLAGILLLGALL